MLVRMLSDLPPGSRILEIGCNAGRNLAHLHRAGFRELAGIEINPHAVRLLRERYPELSDAEVQTGAVEELLPGVADDSFDLVFTMAVIEHIHPDSEAVFDEMARVARQILAVEPRGHSTHRQFPHDVPEIFRRRGFDLVAELDMSVQPETADDPAMRGYVASRFVRAARRRR